MKASKMPPVIFHYWTRGVRRRLFKRIPVNTSKVAYSFKSQMPTYTENYLAEVSQITARLDVQSIERIVDLVRNISPNLVRALEYGRQVGASICGIVGRDGGYTAQVADACVVIPVVNSEAVTPHTEAFQAVVWHLLVSHPALQQTAMKWESVQ